MKKHLFLICIALSLAFCSCRPYKAYVGPRQAKSAVAIVIQGNNKLTFDMEETQESALLVKVDDMEVGSNDKGFPRKCEVLAGKRNIEIRHLQQWNDHPRSEPTTVGASDGDSHKHYLVTFKAEAGQTYTIMAVTDIESMQEEIFVIDSDGQRVKSTSLLKKQQ